MKNNKMVELDFNELMNILCAEEKVLLLENRDSEELIDDKFPSKICMLIVALLKRVVEEKRIKIITDEKSRDLAEYFMQLAKEGEEIYE